MVRWLTTSNCERRKSYIGAISPRAILSYLSLSYEAIHCRDSKVLYHREPSLVVWKEIPPLRCARTRTTSTTSAPVLCQIRGKATLASPSARTRTCLNPSRTRPSKKQTVSLRKRVSRLRVRPTHSSVKSSTRWTKARWGAVCAVTIVSLI